MYKNWIDLIGIALTMCCSEYQLLVPRKSCICALISRIPLSDTRIDNLRVKSSNLGDIALIFTKLMDSKDHRDTSLVKF